MTLEIKGKPVVFMDTPGLAWPYEDASPENREQHRAQDILLRNKGRIDHLKDPIPAVSYIVSRAETEDLMVHYCLPAFAKGDVDAFLMAVARANALIKKVRKFLWSNRWLPTIFLSRGEIRTSWVQRVLSCVTGRRASSPGTPCRLHRVPLQTETRP